jgi:hypothetical protein
MEAVSDSPIAAEAVSDAPPPQWIWTVAAELTPPPKGAGRHDHPAPEIPPFEPLMDLQVPLPMPPSLAQPLSVTPRRGPPVRRTSSRTTFAPHRQPDLHRTGSSSQLLTGALVRALRPVGGPAARRDGGPAATLTCADASVQVPVAALITSCVLFAEEPALLDAAYDVHALVGPAALAAFARAVAGEAITVDAGNVRELEAIAAELGCVDVAARCALFAGEMDPLVSQYLEDASALNGDLAGLRERLAEAVKKHVTDT